MNAGHSGAPRTGKVTDRRGPLRLVAVLLSGAVLLFGAVAVARADSFVVFRDPGLRAAVASQLAHQGQIPPGSNGTTITPADMQALTTLSAHGRGITRLDGLQYATALTSLDLSGNRIADLTPLSGLVDLTDLDVVRNGLDVEPGSWAMSVIAALQGLGAHVSWEPQCAGLSQPAVSSCECTYGAWVTFSARVAPRGAAVLGGSSVRLYRLETKTETRQVRGVPTKVAVNYWLLRRTLAMQVSAPESRKVALNDRRVDGWLTQACSVAGLSVRDKLPYAGRWQALVVYGGCAGYESCTSTAMTVVVRDPRIDAAISWATHRLGSHGWDHYCLRFVCDAYAKGAGASVHRYETAKEAADALHASAHPSADAPRGAWVFYHSMHGSTDLGHVGISIGNGMMVNDYGGAGVKIMGIGSTPHYIGWAAPPLTPPITDWNQPTNG